MKYSIEDLKNKFKYNSKTGELLVFNYGKKRKTVVAKSIDNDGYININTKLHEDGKRFNFRAHRIAYELYYNKLLGDMIIDHIDHDKTNNKINNLRPTTREVNNRNLPKRKTNKSGVSGVYQLPGGKWRAQIRVNSKNRHIGCYNTLEEAKEAKLKANIQYGFHENHN